MIHTIILEERRKAPRELAISIGANVYDEKGVLVKANPPQLHSMGERVDDFSNIAYAAEWDGKSPWIVVLKGAITDLKMAYAGWPMEDQAAYEARTKK